MSVNIIVIGGGHGMTPSINMALASNQYIYSIHEMISVYHCPQYRGKLRLDACAL